MPFRLSPLAHCQPHPCAINKQVYLISIRFVQVTWKLKMLKPSYPLYPLLGFGKIKRLCGLMVKVAAGAAGATACLIEASPQSAFVPAAEAVITCAELSIVASQFQT